jgi:hypothetical protein
MRRRSVGSRLEALHARGRRRPAWRGRCKCDDVGERQRQPGGRERSGAGGTSANQHRATRVPTRSPVEVRTLPETEDGSRAWRVDAEVRHATSARLAWARDAIAAEAPISRCATSARKCCSSSTRGCRGASDRQFHPSRPAAAGRRHRRERLCMTRAPGCRRFGAHSDRAGVRGRARAVRGRRGRTRFAWCLALMCAADDCCVPRTHPRHLRPPCANSETAARGNGRNRFTVGELGGETGVRSTAEPGATAPRADEAPQGACGSEEAIVGPALRCLSLGTSRATPRRASRASLTTGGFTKSDIAGRRPGDSG